MGFDGLFKINHLVLSFICFSNIDGVILKLSFSSHLAITGTPSASITISGDLGRESINELGRKLPYYRYVTFPVEVSTDIEVTTVSGDLVDAGSHKDNLSDERIFITLDDTTTFDCGTHNKLQSVTYTGGSTGGENATCTYSYLGFNEFVVNGPA